MKESSLEYIWPKYRNCIRIHFYFLEHLAESWMLIYFYFSIYFFFFPQLIFKRRSLHEFARAHFVPYPEVIENFMPILLFVAGGFCELF